MILFPGFIDTHIHIFQSFLKGLGADHRLIEWLNLSALPYGTIMTARQHELAARLACMEALKSGCTTLCEFFSRCNMVHDKGRLSDHAGVLPE